MMSMDVPTPTLDPRLHDALRSHTLTIFLGADLPETITGLPSRSDLAHLLAERRGLDPSLSLAQVTQRLAKGGYRFDFTSLLREALDVTGKKPQRFHRGVVEFVRNYGIETVVTTAYDGLPETAFRDAGVGINVVVENGDLAFARRGIPTLIRLYGVVDRPASLVATEDDHYGLWRDRNRENVLDEVRTALRRNTVLFLGYNLADPDFNLLWREVLDRMGRFVVGAFAIWPSLQQDEVQIWQDRQITVMEAGKLTFLNDWADEPAISAKTLHEQVAQGTADKGQFAAGKEIQRNMLEEQKAQKKQERDLYQSNLARLDFQAALYGGRQFAPLIVQNQIQEAEQSILRIEGELDEIERELVKLEKA